jgi:Tfp pilus assembly protein FimV
MTTSSRPDSSVTSKVIAGWTLTALSCLIATAAAAAEPAAEGAAPASAATAYTVSQSTAIDKVVQKVYANSPLNTQVLRQALVDANPKVISGNPQQRVKAGTVLTVPDHAHVVRTALTPFATNPDNTESGPAARDYSVRRPWVRFP